MSIDAKRLVFAPEDWTKLSAHGSPPRPESAEVVRLGGPDDGEAVLLLRFAVKLPLKARLQRALLVMDPMPQCGGRPGRVQLALSHVLEPWRSATTSWSRQPQLSLPMRTASIAATPAQPLRLDVTAFVREWGEHQGRYHGLALSIGNHDGGQACFATGLTWGEGPRLEVFLAPKKKKRKDKHAADAGVDAGRDAAADGGEGRTGGAVDSSM